MVNKKLLMNKFIRVCNYSKNVKIYIYYVGNFACRWKSQNS